MDDRRPATAVTIGVPRDTRYPNLLRHAGWQDVIAADPTTLDEVQRRTHARLILAYGFEASSAIRAWVTAHRATGPGPYVYVIALLADADAATRDWLRQGGVDAVVDPAGPDHDLLDRLAVATRINQLEDAAAASENRLRARMAEVDRDLVRAAQVQRALLPRKRHWPAGLEVAWEWIPSATLGGDAIALSMIDGRYLAFTVLDVMGHGTAAALVAVQAARALLPALGEASIILDECDANRPTPPLTVLEQLDRLFPDATQPGFITVLHGVLDTVSGRLDLASAGHPPPVIIDGDGKRLDPTGLNGTPIGCGLPLLHGTHAMTLRPGARICCFSDGLSEAFDADEQDFGRERIAAGLAGRTPSEAIRALTDGLVAWTGNRTPNDDVAMLCLRWQPMVQESTA